MIKIAGYCCCLLVAAIAVNAQAIKKNDTSLIREYEHYFRPWAEKAASQKVELAFYTSLLVDTLNAADFRFSNNVKDIELYEVDSAGNRVSPTVTKSPETPVKEPLFSTCYTRGDTLFISSGFSLWSGFAISILNYKDTILANYYEFTDGGAKLLKRKLQQKWSDSVSIPMSVKGISMISTTENNQPVIYVKVKLSTAPFYEKTDYSKKDFLHKRINMELIIKGIPVQLPADRNFSAILKLFK